VPAQAATTPGLSAAPDVVVGEADASVTLPVTLSAASTSTVTVNYTTANGSGTGDTFCGRSTDVFQGQSGTLTFAPGKTTQNVTVSLLNCHASLSYGFYTFYLNLSTASGATIQRASTQVDVTGDAAASSTPGLFVKGATVDASAGSVQVPVLLGGPSGAAQGVPVTVNYATANGSAKAGTDYTATSGTLTFPPGETTQNITVPILDPAASEPTRNFSVTLSSPSNATIATGTGTVTIGASGATAVSNPLISAPIDMVVGQADGYVALPVTLNAPGIGTASVNYTTANGSGTGDTFCGRSTDVAQGESGTLTFTPGVTTQVVRVPLLDCGTTQPLTFLLNLSGAIGATISDASTTITVADFPTITSFTPASGPVGTVVTIKGTNLGDVVSVTFNGTPATVKKDAANKVKVVVPTGATKGPITVKTVDGSVTSIGKFKVT
jgi:chitinase